MPKIEMLILLSWIFLGLSFSAFASFVSEMWTISALFGFIFLICGFGFRLMNGQNKIMEELKNAIEGETE